MRVLILEYMRKYLLQCILYIEKKGDGKHNTEYFLAFGFIRNCFV